MSSSVSVRVGGALVTGLLAALALAVPVSPATAAVTSAAAAPLAGQTYVALGDSFTADWGVDPVASNQPSAGCRQSTNDYPHQVAANLGLALKDVSCAGALTTNMTQPQTQFPDEQTHPAAPPQFNALTPTTNIVSIGIGGNDFGFSTIAGACAVNPLTGYVFGNNWPNWYSTCRAYYNPSGQPADDSLRARILDVVGPAVQQTVAAIKTHSPKATVFFVDYLALAPDPANAPNPADCYRSLLHDQSFPFGAVDTVYLAGLQALLNQTIDAAATKAGATVVSPYGKSLAHSPCYGTPDPWVNGITTDITSGGARPTDTPGAPPPSPTTTPTGDPKASRLGSSDVAVGSLHPNLEGAIQQSESVTFAMLETLGGVGATGSPTTSTATVTQTATATTTATATVTTTATVTGSSAAAGASGSGGGGGSAPQGSTSTPAPAAAPAVPPVSAARGAGLAATGSSPLPLVLAGAALMAVGLAVLLLSRVRRRRA